MRRKHEVVDGAHICCWDDGEKWADRYTVVYLDDEQNGMVPYVAMGPSPFNPQGFGQHGEMPINCVQYRGRGGAFDKRIPFNTLPPDCQTLVRNDIKGAF